MRRAHRRTGLVATLVVVATALALLPAGTGSAIEGGEPASWEEYPWFVRLGASDGPSGNLCGGALIRNRWVLTAAHCVDSYDDEGRRSLLATTVHFQPTGRDTGTGPVLTVRPRDIFVHPSYDSPELRGTGAYDIALVRLPRGMNQYRTAPLAPAPPVLADGSSGPVPVPGEGAGVRATVVGVADGELKDLTVSLDSEDTCENEDDNADDFFGLFPEWQDYDAAHNLCTVTDADGFDQGDSGGPLVSFEFGQAWLIGVVSWEKDNSIGSDEFNVYARVAAAREFIDATMTSQSQGAGLVARSRFPVRMVQATEPADAEPVRYFAVEQVDVVPGAGNRILVSDASGDGAVYVDDALDVYVVRPDGTIASRTVDFFDEGCGAPRFEGPLDITDLFSADRPGERHTVLVRLRDVCGQAQWNTDLWLTRRAG